jgi:hypothetical protein
MSTFKIPDNATLPEPVGSPPHDLKRRARRKRPPGEAAANLDDYVEVKLKRGQHRRFSHVE